MRRSLLRLSIPLREPFVTAGGVVQSRELALIRLEDDEGNLGFGEAAPLEPYDGITVDDVWEALREGPPSARRAAAGARGVGAGRARPPVPPARPSAGRARPGRHPREQDAGRRPARGDRGGGPRGRPGRLLVLQGQGRPAGRPRARGRRPRGGGLRGPPCGSTRTAPGSRTRRWPASRSSPRSTSRWSSSPAARSRSWHRCAPGSRCRSPPTSRSWASRRSASAAEAGACDVVNVKLAGSGGYLPAREAVREAERNGLRAFLSSTLDGPWGIAAVASARGRRGRLARLRAGNARALRRPDRQGAGAAAERAAGRAAGPGAGRGGRSERIWMPSRSTGSHCQELLEEARHRLGPLELRGVAGVLHQLEAAVRHARGHAARRFGVALVAGAGDRQQGQVEAGQVVPDRLQRPLARRAQQRGQVRGLVGQPARRAAPRSAPPPGRRTAAGAPTRPRSPRCSTAPSTPPSFSSASRVARPSPRFPPSLRP